MRTRSKLRLDALAVESFQTGAVPLVEGGTVDGYACTVGNSCYCPTAYVECGTEVATRHSCQRTAYCA
jgi:hypothetical protein